MSNTAHAQGRKKEKLTVLDGLVIDLFNRVEAQLDYSTLTADDHAESIGAIHRLLQQIQKQEKERVSKTLAKVAPLESAEARMAALKDWLHAKGVETAGLDVCPGLPEGCGVVATRDFTEGELLAKVPQDLVMTVVTALKSQSDIAALFHTDRWFRNIPSLILTMHLLFEKHRETPESKWKGYIRSLPGQLSLQEHNSDSPDSLLMPLAFSAPAVNELRGTTALVEYHRMLRTIAKQYCHMRTVLHQLGAAAPVFKIAATTWFTFAEFRWAVTTVMQRQNPIPMLGAVEEGKGPESAPFLGTTLALIPLLDMFNHEEGPITSHFDAASSAVEITAKRTFKAGEQVYVSYGSRPSLMMLLYNGLLPEVNSRDRTRLELNLPEGDPLYAKKVSLFKWLELPPRAQVDIFCDGSPSAALEAWLFVAGMAEEVEITAALRQVIAQETEHTAKRLEEQKASEEKASREKANQDVASAEDVSHAGKEGGAAWGAEGDANGHLENGGGKAEAGHECKHEHGKECQHGHSHGKSTEEQWTPAWVKFMEIRKKEKGQGGSKEGEDKEKGKGMGASPLRGFSTAHLDFLITAASARLEALEQGRRSAEAAGGSGKGSEASGGPKGPKGLGMGLKRASPAVDKKPTQVVERERWMTRKLWESEYALARKLLDDALATKAALS